MGFKNYVAVMNIYHFVSLVFTTFEGTVPESDIKLLLTEGIKYLVPTNAPPKNSVFEGCRNSKWLPLFQKYDKDLTPSAMKMLATPMEGSVVFKRRGRATHTQLVEHH